MKKNEPMIWAYAKEKRWFLLLFKIFLVLFALVYDLYGERWEAYFYGAALCITVGAAAGGIDFIRFCRNHQKRQGKLCALREEWEHLPPPETLGERDYQAMVTSLGQSCRELATALHTKNQESLDYYTTWAHQIKTPIAVMQLILKGEDTQEHRALSAELFRIEQYVEMVLSYLRLGSDTTDFVFQTHSLDTLIRQSIRKYAPQFIQKKLRLVYVPTDVTVLTDEKWLCFLLEQLLSNAVKYTYEGSVTISVTEEKVLTLRDTGIGIAPEDLPRIFEKGFTGYNGRLDKKSTGLGLYLCKQTAEKLGIAIAASSSPGEGTEITLDLSSHPLEVE